MKVIATQDFVHRDEGRFKEKVVYDVLDNEINNQLIYVGYFKKVVEEIKTDVVGEIKEAKVVKKTKEAKFRKETK